jgi:hypothetical protein
MHQALEAGLCFVVGILSATLYYLAKFLLTLLKSPKTVFEVCDFFVAVSSALLLFFAVERINYGQLLYYHFIAAVSGFFCWSFFFKKLFLLCKGAAKLRQK